MSATSQTPHSILRVVETRSDFTMQEEISRILIEITCLHITPERSGSKTGKVPGIRDGKISKRTAAKIRG